MIELYDDIQLKGTISDIHFASPGGDEHGSEISTYAQRKAFLPGESGNGRHITLAREPKKRLFSNEGTAL